MVVTTDLMRNRTQGVWQSQERADIDSPENDRKIEECKYQGGYRDGHGVK